MISYFSNNIWHGDGILDRDRIPSKSRSTQLYHLECRNRPDCWKVLVFQTINIATLLRFVSSIASGLEYLHSEIKSTQCKFSMKEPNQLSKFRQKALHCTSRSEGLKCDGQVRLDLLHRRFRSGCILSELE